MRWLLTRLLFLAVLTVRNVASDAATLTCADAANLRLQLLAVPSHPALACISCDAAGDRWLCRRWRHFGTTGAEKVLPRQYLHLDQRLPVCSVVLHADGRLVGACIGG